MKPLGMTPYRLAKGLRMSPAAIGEIIKARRAITAETALRLEVFFGTRPGWWLAMQSEHDLRAARFRLEQVGELALVERFDLGKARERCERDEPIARAA